MLHIFIQNMRKNLSSFVHKVEYFHLVKMNSQTNWKLKFFYSFLLWEYTCYFRAIPLYIWITSHVSINFDSPLVQVAPETNSKREGNSKVTRGLRIICGHKKWKISGLLYYVWWQREDNNNMFNECSSFLAVTFFKTPSSLQLKLWKNSFQVYLPQFLTQVEVPFIDQHVHNCTMGNDNE